MLCHTPSDLASWFLTLYLREMWRRVGERAGHRPVALYGAGRHTLRMLQIVGETAGGPHVAVILDDDPVRDGINGIPVRRPDAVDPASVAAVIVSTDTLQERLGARALAWSGGGDPAPEVVRLYDDVPEGPYVTEPAVQVQQRAPGAPLERRAAVPRPTIVAPRRSRRRPDGAIEPVLDQVTHLQTPSFSVHLNALRLSIPEIFRAHQLYPADELRIDEFVTRSEPGLVTPDTRVSVVGSCFAFRFKKWLVQHGYNFCQFEDGPMAQVGSVRSGPIFNTGSLRQLFDWAYAGFDAQERYWPVDEWLFDPYRKAICWPDEASAEAERAAHFDAVRRMLRDSEVLIVTLGLSEVWRNRRDGCAFHLMPPREVFDERRHEHALLSVDENLANLDRFHARVRAANPDLRLVLTLSPVPLAATYQDRHAVVADTVSKALLRAAIDAFCRAHPEVLYFPSYEIVTRMPEWPYTDDNRHVRETPIVDRVMATFMQHYGTNEQPSPGMSEARSLRRNERRAAIPAR